MPVESQSRAGWLDRPVDPLWIDIQPDHSFETYVVNAAIDAEGLLRANTMLKIGGGSVAKVKRQVGINEADYLSAMAPPASLQVPEEGVLKLDQTNGSLSGQFSYTQHLLGENASGEIILPAILLNIIRANPFEGIDRVFSVSLPHTYGARYVLSLKLPDNCEIASVPENKVYTFGDDSAIAKFICQKREGSVDISFTYGIDELDFPAHDYENLQAFYDHIISACDESISLVIH